MCKGKYRILICCLLIVTLSLTICTSPLFAEYNPDKGDDLLDKMHSKDLKITAIILGTALVVGLVIYYSTRDKDKDDGNEESIRYDTTDDIEYSDTSNQGLLLDLCHGSSRLPERVLKEYKRCSMSRIIRSYNYDNTRYNKQKFMLEAGFANNTIYIGIGSSF